jgi:hypothetical protein
MNFRNWSILSINKRTTQQSVKIEIMTRLTESIAIPLHLHQMKKERKLRTLLRTVKEENIDFK